MIEQNAVTTYQFKERIKETKLAKTNLAKHLDKVMTEIGNLEKNMIELQKGIENKDGPLMVSETRRAIRQERPNVEYCVDPPHTRLRAETAEIEQSILRYFVKLDFRPKFRFSTKISVFDQNFDFRPKFRLQWFKFSKSNRTNKI